MIESDDLLRGVSHVVAYGATSVATPVEEVRALVGGAVRSIDADRGGRQLNRIAQLVGVDRATVGRWRDGVSTPSIEHARSLAAMFPEYLDIEMLEALYRAMATGRLDIEVTTGLSVTDSPASTYGWLAAALDEEAIGRDRELLHVAFHLDLEGVGDDRSIRVEIGAEMEAARRAMVRRAAEGWRIRSVFSVGRLDRLENLVDDALWELRGTDVEIRAYPYSLPLVTYPIVVGGRHVVFARDDRRLGRPATGLVLTSPAAVSWARSYFADLYDDAPFRLRTVRGVDDGEVQRLRQYLERQSVSR